jgi:hypothetical protein
MVVTEKAGSEGMALNSRPDPHVADKQGGVWSTLVFVFCVLFGFAMIVNTQAAGDGGWFWYASYLLNGRRLYADMHLALQPLFVLETASFLTLLGKGWLVSKVPAALHVIAYCAGLLLVVRASKSELTDPQKALVLACAFFVSIDFEAYRFDDYHVLADCFEVYSILVLLQLDRRTEKWRAVGMAAGLGVLSGLSMMTRLNDGAALFVGVAIAIVCMVPTSRLLSLAAFAVAGALTVMAVVGVSGDSLHDYATYSIVKAAGSKGGTGSVLKYPLQLPWNTLRFFKDRQTLELTIYLVALGAIWALLILPFLRNRSRANLAKLLAGVALVLLPLHHFYGGLLDTRAIVALSGVGVLVAYALGVIVFARLMRWAVAAKQARVWNRREVLLLIPLGQLASSSMSSGGRHIGLYGPLAMMILVLPLASPIRLRSEWAKAFALAMAMILVIDCAAYKYRYPYLWHSYKAGPLFVGRQWYRHPDYGPMVIERPLLDFIEPVCNRVRGDGAEKGLLSLPFSYSNYFCSIEPWHGYVQTFFDTSTKETIDGLMVELQTAPPKWILYQRQLNNLKLHEGIFNQGKPLPHRYLDQMIEAKIASGDWKPVYASTYGSGGFYSNDWVLLQTSP